MPTSIFKNSLRARLILILLLVSLIPLVIVAGLYFWQARQTLETSALREVSFSTKSTSQDIQTFMAQFQTDLLSLSHAPPVQGIIRALDNENIDPQSNDSYETWVNRLNEIMEPIADNKKFYQQLRYLDEHGQELARVDFDGNQTTVVPPAELQNKSDRSYFGETMKLNPGEIYVSPLNLNREQGQIQEPHVPVLRFGTPIFDATGQQRGIVVLNVYAASFLDRLKLDTAQTYLANQDGYYLKHPDQAQEFGFDLGTEFNIKQDFSWALSQMADDNAFGGIDQAANRLVDIKKVQFDPDQPQRYWLLVNSVAESVVLEGVETLTLLTLGVFGVVAIIVVAVAIFVSNTITHPISVLAGASEKIAKGNWDAPVPITRSDEIGQLADNFRKMTTQLQGLVDNLEERVLTRTQRLEFIATLGEQLLAILNFDQLLVTLVNQVKESFDYYHVHIYIVDAEHQKLVISAGSGEAGVAMKAKGHAIPINASTSLVAQAARTRQLATIDNVRETLDWLPNPLLPDTYAEMAVPIIVDNQVVGVLDVQEDKIAGLDESDASMLHLLANQAAVAIRNALLFTEVETTLADARATQAQYQQLTWDEVQKLSRSGVYDYHQPNAQLLDETTIAQLEQEAMTKNQPITVSVKGDEEIENALIAPIRLQDQAIGTIQLHSVEQQHQWNEQELALVQTVASQVAQAAENIRLFEETRERASYEQLVGEITQKLRRASTLEVLVKTASEELGQALGVSHSVVKVGVTPTQDEG